MTATAVPRETSVSELAARFFALVDTTAGMDACWPWTGNIDGSGYGRVEINLTRWLAHRLAWTVANGQIPDGLFACHTCDNPPCCNPAHLFLGTNADNMADRHAKGRYAGQRGEAGSAAKLTEAEVLVIKRRLAAGETQPAIAPDFGVSRATIGHIAQGRKWSWVR